ncbi:MAG: AsmA-like C-terminal domain-containing protein [Thermodesulfobacteriota bacterium]|nr:AsmA-like C-terminal domain-containing protein [Thermodesulfobacteriota bacterium]
MGRRKKIYVLISGCVGVLFLILIAFILFAPKIINSQSMKDKILTDLSARTGGQAKLAGIDLSFFPLPHVVIHQGSLVIPGKVSAAVGSITVYPRIWPLITGKLQIAQLRVQKPHVKIQLPATQKRQKGIPIPFPQRDFEKELARALGPIATQTEGLAFQIANGRIDLVKEETSLFWFSEIQGHIRSASKQMKIDLACKSNLWDGISIKGTLDLTDLKTDGQIQLNHFSPHTLADYLLPEAPLQIGDSEMDLNLSFKADGLKSIQTEMQSSIPYLTLQKQDNKTVLKGVCMKGSVDMEEGKASISLSELNLEYPRLSLTGTFSMDQDPGQVVLKLEGKDIDVHSLREVALSMAGELPPAQDIFAIVKGGKVPVITFNSKGNSLASLEELKNILIKGRMLDGQIFVPGVDLDLTNVIGDVVISKGILQGEGLEASMGKTHTNKAGLKLGLEGKDAPFHLDAIVKADLAQVPPILKRIVDNKSFLEHLAQIKGVKGEAVGRLLLDGTTSRMKVSVDISEMNLSCIDERLPYPLQIYEGGVSYDDTGIEVKNQRGKMGETSFSELSGRADWELEKEPHIEITSGKVDILLDEIYPWISSFEGLRKHLKEIGSVKGHLSIDNLDIKGLLLSPQKWHFNTQADFKDIIVHSTLLPGPITVVRGGVQADSKTLVFQDVGLKSSDAQLRLTAALKGYMEGLRMLETTFEGDLGPDAIGWASDLIELPGYLRVKSPLDVSKAHLTWRRNGETSFKGDLVVTGGPEVSIELCKGPEELKITQLLIKDKESHASLSLNLKKDIFDIGFAGNVQKATLDNLLAENRILTGWIKGDFKARVLKDQPMQSTVQGRFQGGGLDYPELDLPIKIEGISLNADQNSVNVESAGLTWNDRHGQLNGKLHFGEKGILLDLALTSDGIDWGNINKAFEKKESDKDGKQAKKAWHPPVEGTVRLKADYFKYGEFTWRPFNANISFGEDGIEVAVTEAGLCGISTPGVMKITPNEVWLDFKPLAQNQQLNPTAQCLTDEEITAVFDMKGEITGKGKPEELAEWVRGNLEFSAKDGQINRSSMWTNIFAYLNVTEVFRGKLPDLKDEGFKFYSAKVKGELKDGKLLLKEGAIDGVSLDIAFEGDIDIIEKKLDLTVLVAPMKTANWIINHIPLVNYILDGTLFSIPIKVSGDMADPEVTALSVSAVGSALIGLLKRTATSPVKVIETVTPEWK